MSSAMTTQRATLIGLLAPLCWGMGVSLVRGIAEGFGLAQGQTLLYITAAVCLFFVIGIPDLRTVDRRYLILACRQPTRARYASRSLSFFLLAERRRWRRPW